MKGFDPLKMLTTVMSNKLSRTIVFQYWWWEMFPETQIIILEWFLKDHATLKTWNNDAFPLEKKKIFG